MTGGIEKESNEYKLLKAEIKHLRELRKVDFKALKLQRKEYERRLNNLNGEHQNIKENQARSVLREIYKSEQDEQDNKIEKLLSWKSNYEGKQASAKYFAVAGLILSAITLILWIIKTFNQ